MNENEDIRLTSRSNQNFDDVKGIEEDVKESKEDYV